jgi:large subunit ribosomal protein L15
MYMEFELSHLKPSVGARKSKRRIGRGEGSGAGKTSGRGGKGQTARTGGKVKARFEGGQVPLYRRIPKLGFVSRKKVLGKNTFVLVKLSDLDRHKDGASIDLTATPTSKGFPDSRRIKIVGSGKITKKVKVKTYAITAGARAAIEKAGGTVELVK